MLDTIVELQRPDGNYGYTCSTIEKKVLDWDGSAGCWFAAGMALAYKLTGAKKYLDSAGRALGFYSRFVDELYCWGTPMDTWKSVHQEGVLAYIRTARVLHEDTRMTPSCFLLA